MVPGTLIRLAPGLPHRVEAKEDSRLLVTMIKPSDASAWNALAPRGRTLDLRQTPRERRHSTVFYAFDTLGSASRSSWSTITIRNPCTRRWSNYAPANWLGNTRYRVLTNSGLRSPGLHSSMPVQETILAGPQQK